MSHLWNITGATCIARGHIWDVFRKLSEKAIQQVNPVHYPFTFVVLDFFPTNFKGHQLKSTTGTCLCTLCTLQSKSIISLLFKDHIQMI